MSTQSLSVIKTARRPSGADSYPCRCCKSAICPGDQYFCYQIGQRSSIAFCLDCIRKEKAGGIDICMAREIYRKKYGMVEP